MATPGKNDVQINISGEARQLENLIEKLMGMIRQLQEAAQSVSVGGVGGGMSGGGTMGGGLPGGFASGSSMVNRSAQPSSAPIGTAGRGTSAQPRSVSPGMGGASGMVGASTSYYTPAFTRADGGIQSMAGGRFGPMLPGHVMSQVNPGMAYDPSVQNATGLGRYFPSDLLQGMSSYFPSDYGMGSARRSASVIEQSMMNPRSVATWGVRGGGIPDFTDGWMTSQFPSEMYGGMPVGGAIAQMYQGDAARLSAIRARGTAVGMGARVIGAPSPLTGMPFASDIGHGPAAQSAAIMMAPERAAFGDALMGAASWSSVRGAIGERMAALAPYKPYAEGAMIVASMYGQQYYQGQIERMMTGRPDRMLEAGATGSLFGGMIGTAIGAPMGGAGAYVGAFAGTTIGGMMGQYFAGADVRDTRIGVSLLPLAAHSAYRAGDMGHWGIGYGGEDHDGYSAVWRNPSLPAMVKRLAPRTKTVSGVIGRAFWQPPFDSDGNPAKEDAYMDYYATQEQVANMYGTAYQGFADAGFDPEMRIGATSALSVAGTSIANAFGNKAEDAISGRGKGFTLGRLVASVGGVAVGNSVARGGNSTQLYDWLGQNVAARYGTAGEGMMPGIMQMVGALRSVGGGIDSNGISTGPSGLIDLLMKFGTTRTAQFINAATPMGEKISTGESTLRDMVAKMQENEYLIKATSFDARGVGGRTEAMLKTMTSDIAAFPGGKGSLTYREVDARRRSAMFQRFAETDMEDFDIPMTRLQGQLDRSQLLPYAPGYSMGMEMQGFNARNVHLRTLEKRLETLKSRGDLSESQELAMVGQIEGLRTRNAQTIASLSEGMENRLPAMSAGRPFWAGRFNSMQLAAMYMRGPARFTGAYGGGQLAMQDDFARGIGLPSGTGSLTSGLNNGGAMSAITGYLAQIAANTGKTASEKTLPERRDPGGSRGRIN